MMHSSPACSRKI